MNSQDDDAGEGLVATECHLRHINSKNRSMFRSLVDVDPDAPLPLWPGTASSSKPTTSSDELEESIRQKQRDLQGLQNALLCLPRGQRRTLQAQLDEREVELHQLRDKLRVSRGQEGCTVPSAASQVALPTWTPSRAKVLSPQHRPGKRPIQLPLGACLGSLSVPDHEAVNVPSHALPLGFGPASQMLQPSDQGAPMWGSMQGQDEDSLEQSPRSPAQRYKSERVGLSERLPLPSFI